MYKKIYNPETGRKVNVNGKLGKQILRKYLHVLNGGAGRGPSSATLNMEYLQSAAEIKLSLLSLRGQIKGGVETTRKTRLKDLVDKVSDKLSIDKDKLRLMLKGGIKIWPKNSPGNMLLEDLGIIQDMSIYYSIILPSLVEAIKSDDTNKKQQAKSMAERHQADLREWEGAVEEVDGWGDSYDEDEDGDAPTYSVERSRL